MKHITRLALDELYEWKQSRNRKPLVIRGARQVGKTTLIEEFSKTYKHSITLNLEHAKDKRYFTEFDNVQTITEALCISHNIQTTEKKDTLLFIDEIQELPLAINMLRYFYEKEPDLHVIAAGSLLEQAIKKIKSFPVGRVNMLYLHPMNFLEFLQALGKYKLIEELHNLPIRKEAHQTLLEHFNRYAIIGGMPEVVNRYAETNAINDLSPIYESIWETYKSDVMKYATNNSEARIIRHIMRTAHLFVDKRIKFQNFGNSNYRSREVGESFRNLDDAKVIQMIYPTTCTAPPLIEDLKKSPRIQFLDTGLVNYGLNIQAEMLELEDLSTAYKGAIIPHLIAQEVISLNLLKNTKPNFWVREKNQSSAEVDMIIQYSKMLVPIEIKSGSEGKLKSLHQFIDMSPHQYAVRMYAGQFSIETHSTPDGKSYFLMNLPYYLGTKLFDYLEYFIFDSHPKK